MTAPTDNYDPVNVHVVGVSQDIQSRLIPTRAVKRERVIVTNSYLLVVGADPSNILSHSPKRCYGQVVVNGTTGSIVAIGTSRSDVQDAINVGTNEFIGAVAYVNGGYPAVIPLTGTSELWAGLVTAGSGPTVVSVFKEFDT